MIVLKTRFMLGALLASGTAVGAAPAHDMRFCAMINKDYIVGAKLNTPNGVFRRGENGSFAHTGINFPGVYDCAFDPRDPQVMYLATLNGCMVSRDGGKTHRVTTDWRITETKSVCVDPHAPDHVYLATPDGIAVSTDRGETWTRREHGLPERGKFTQIVKVDRTRAGRVFAGCEKGIFLTENGGDTWRCVFPAKRTVVDVQQSPHDPRLWLAATEGAGALVSRDNGATWTKFAGVSADHPIYNIAFDATNARRFALGSWTYGVMTTEDGGESWVTRNAGLPGEGHVFRVAIDPDDGRLYANVHQDFVYVSDDFGRTWLRQGLEGAIVYGFIFTPRTPPTP